MEKMRNIKRLKWFAMSFIGFVVVFGALHCGVALLARMRQSGVMVYLLSIHRLLERDVETSGKPEPTRFSPVRRSKQEYYLKDADTYYYPQAWNKPGRILLTHRCGAVEYVIFGDGSRAGMTYWSTKSKDTTNTRVEPTRFHARGLPFCMFGNFWFIYFTGAIVAIAISWARWHERDEKTESAKSPEA